jgi:hypothetical protein
MGLSVDTGPFKPFFMIVIILSGVAVGFILTLCVCRSGKESYKERADFIRFAIQHALTFASCCQLDAEIDAFQEEFYDDAPEQVAALCIELYDLYHAKVEELQPVGRIMAC